MKRVRHGPGGQRCLVGKPGTIIALESTPDQGTAVHISLPFTRMEGSR